jgi:hypothetical protein
MNPTSPCRIVTVYAFRGDHSKAFVALFLRALANERSGTGPGLSILAGLLYAGHAGVSTGGGRNIYGFNPDAGSLPVSELMDELQAGKAFPGLVSNDTAVFNAATAHGLNVFSFQVLLPDNSFDAFQQSLDNELVHSRFKYGYPDGNGDCNCITWLERISLPLLTGLMREFAGLPAITAIPSRRFGECV